MMSLVENHDRGTFEGRVCQDLEWLKTMVEKIQILCEGMGQRIGYCETSVVVLQSALKYVSKYEERFRNIETDITKAKTVCSLVGVLGGFLASIGIKVWWK